MRTRIAGVVASLSISAGAFAADPGVGAPTRLPTITETAPAEPSAGPRGPSLAVEPIPHNQGYYAPANTAPSNTNRVWATTEVLGWWVQGQTLPVLATTSLAGTPVGSAGVLGRPTTLPVIGGQRVNDQMRIGGRVTLGWWLDDCKTCGIAGEFFILNQDGERYTITSSGTPILARPFASVPGGLLDAQITAFPGIAAGSISVDASNNLLGAGVFGIHEICCGCNYNVYALAGYRYLRLQDRVSILEQVTSTGGLAGLPAGTTFALRDSIETVNQFHGGDIGLAGRVYRGRVFGDFMGRLGIGGTHRELTSSGETRIGLPGQPPVPFQGGLLTQGPPRHITDNTFSLVPELRLNLGYTVSPNLDVFVGYSVLWWTNVIRAGEQINLRVNPAALPPPLTSAVPVQGLIDTTIWAQGINFGLNFRY